MPYVGYFRNVCLQSVGQRAGLRSIYAVGQTCMMTRNRKSEHFAGRCPARVTITVSFDCNLGA